MRLVLCDDNRILCEALAVAMEARGHQVVAIAATAADGIAAADAHQPDAVLLDLRFPAGPDTSEAVGLAAAKSIRLRCPGTAVLVLSGLADRSVWSAAMRIGVAGVLSKDQSVCKIAAALDVIAAGGVVFDPVASRPGREAGAARWRSRPLSALTPREEEVLRRLVGGQSTGQMASEMHIAISTLRTYVKNVLIKLGAHSRLQAAALATRENLLSDVSA
jgi:two-component system, NarL family, nitrate/nitrite response regulator NarL